MATSNRGLAPAPTHPAPQPAHPVRVLFIGGEGRSGSTLLDRALGQIGGLVSVGEVREVWTWGLQRDALCGCGLPFRDCAFWRSVGDEAYGGWDRVDAQAMLGLALDAERRAKLAALIPGVRPDAPPLLDYTEPVRRLYEAIRSCAGASAIVDSSKVPAAAFVLRAAGLDVRAIHLIRDSRGVAYSWAKAVDRPDAGGGQMRRFGAARVAWRWMGRNLLMERLGASGTSMERIRYEDLVAGPADVLASAAALAGVPAEPGTLPVGTDGGLLLATNHTIMGNAMRMRTGRVELALDDEWRTRMGPAARRTVRLLTWPLARRYGYRS